MQDDCTTFPLQDPTFLAWLGGFFDGEGCVSVTLTTNRCGSPQYRPQLNISNAHREALVYIASQLQCGGPYRGNDKPGFTPTFQWAISGERAIALARLLLPHLRVKHAAAELLTHFQAARGTNQYKRRDPALIAEQERLYLAIRSLNLGQGRVGRPRVRPITRPI